jgi:hypothetical protein
LTLLAAAFAVLRLEDVPSNIWRRIRQQQRKMRSDCLRSPLMALIYRPARAALAARGRPSDKTQRELAAACQQARLLGDASALIYLYRLGAAVFVQDESLRRHYETQTSELTAMMRATPSLSYHELGRGTVGPAGL